MKVMLVALSAALTLHTAAQAQTPVPTAEVPALVETAPVGTANDDAADDPAIWRNRRAPEESLIVATDKKAELLVHDLTGAIRARYPAGLVNNVDLRDKVKIGGDKRILVAASDRTDLAQGHVALFTLTPGPDPKLEPLARLPAGAGESYGFCLWRRRSDRALFAITPFKDGTVRQHRIDFSGSAPTAVLAREFKLETQPEGCVADDRTGLLYVGEEGRGVWRVSADPAATAPPELIVQMDGSRLVADVEGVAIAPKGRRGGRLIVSSQGDNAYAVYDLETAAYQGRFRIVAAGAIDAASETDGIELALGDFGPQFPHGLFVAQDGDNAPEAQNFKLASWAAILTALGLD